MAMRLGGSLLIVCALVTGAAAQGRDADQLFSEGRALLAANKPKEACEKFEAAIKIDATATGTMLNLGLCYETLKKYATSIRWFRKAQAAAAENNLSDYENAAKDHTTTIIGLVNTLKITLDGVAEAEVLIDGERVEPTEYGRYEIDPGTHVIVARARGKKKVEQSIDVPERQPGEPNPAIPVTLALTEDAVPVYVDRGAGRRTAALWLGVGGVAAMAFSGGYGLWQKGRFDKAMRPQQEDIQLQVRYIGTSVFIVGAGLLATAGYLYFTAEGKEQVSDGTAFAPVVAPDQLGFAVSGSF